MLNDLYLDGFPISGVSAMKLPPSITSPPGGLSDPHSSSAQQSNNTSVPPPRSWSIGKVSVFILLFFSITDVVLHFVDAQMESLEAPDHYDALSADVIRPAFRYHGSDRGNKQQRRRPSMGLGSAAISSVTTALSPILPFTGGLDLRREDYWTNGVFGSVTSVIQQVRDAFEGSPTFTTFGTSTTLAGTNVALETPRGGSTVAWRTLDKPAKNKSEKSSQASFVFSNSEPYLPLKEIAELTLGDIATSFRFAVESTRSGFADDRFTSSLAPRARKVVERMTQAVATALGKAVFVSQPHDGLTPSLAEPVPGDIDALNFCAAMRVFAEWRVLRQVPPGYKGYAVGISLGQKDIVQNLAKIEQAVHNFVEHRSFEQEMNTGSDQDGNIDSPARTTSGRPTLRDLLQYEIDIDLHDNAKLPRLKEKSAAMGLLWVRRQLQYQTALFSNVPNVPSRFETTRAAVQSAYDEVYNKYHGWAVQKIFSYSFQAAPEANVIFNFMNPHRLVEVTEEARAQVLGDSLGRHHQRRQYFGGNKDDVEMGGNPIDRLGRHIGNEWGKLADNVLNEWDKVASNVAQLFGQQSQPKPLSAFSPDSISTDTLSVQKELEIENYIDQAMKMDACEHISAYLEVASPILDDLARLFDEYNMDDPAKV